MVKIEQSTLQRDRTKFIRLHVREIFKNKQPLPLSIIFVIKTSPTLAIKTKMK